MQRTTSSPAGDRIPEVPMLTTRLADAHLDAMISGDAARRALVVGPAGSGKSRTLRRLRRTLTANGVRVVFAGQVADIRALAPEDVLLVDDGHLLDDTQLAEIADRVADEDASIIVAARPVPRGAALQGIADALERVQPPIVLGHVTRADVQARSSSPDEAISTECVDDVICLTGGTAWLVAESLELHRDLDCTDGPRHESIREALQDVIAHRLQTAAPDVRDVVVAHCAAAEGSAVSADDGLVQSAYAEGLLLRNGRPAPVVRAAVRATVPPEPEGDATSTAVHLASAEWSKGNPDAASALLDSVTVESGHPDVELAVDTAAAIWATRGLAAMSDRAYRSFEPASPEAATHGAIAALAVADRERLLALTTSDSPAHTMPSTLSVAMDLLGRGMRETLTGSAHGALNDLVRASEMYSSSGSDAPIPELPAVIAALAAISLGELDVADSVLEEALREGHGGRWAHDRLVLWRTWVSLQQEHAHDVEASVQSVLPGSRTLSPRDRLLFDAISIAIARRYHDLPALTVAWRGARASLLRARFDLFSFLPLGEFVLTAARVGETDRMRPHFADALAQLDGLGSPPLWSAHLHWTGIQQGILLGRPEDLAPHARALVGAAQHNRLAAMMAQAGRVWTAVLSGTVDPDQIESAALGLASVGLAWDGARLAGHGAGRSDDRRVISRLLACARRLHPREDIRPAAVEGEAVAAPRTRSHTELSPRELEVAALVVEGKTYAEIGSAIFISPRTAEHHIARIRRRLGATNRSDLIAKLRIVMEDGRGDADDDRVDDQRASA